MASAGLITYPTSGPIGKLADLLAAFAASVNTAIPVKFGATLAAINALQLNADSLPAGTLAILTANDSGLAAGAEFIMNPDGKWRLSGSVTALNVATFVTALATNTRIKTLQGTVVYNQADSSLYYFTNTAGATDSVTTLKAVSGSGTTTSAVAINGTFSKAITFPGGSFSATPSNILVTCNSSRLTPAAVSRTATGFTLQLSNWSPGAVATGLGYTWTAWA